MRNWANETEKPFLFSLMDTGDERNKTKGDSYKDVSDFADLTRLLPRGFGREAGRCTEKAHSTVEVSPPSTAMASEGPVETPLKADVRLPLTQHLNVKQHKKLVSSIDLDRAGSRMVSGSHDLAIAFYDFAGMDNTFEPFRFLRPSHGCPIRKLQFSPSGDQLLVIGSGTPLLLDRNGSLIREYGKGDPYLRDMKITAGHVSGVLSCDWHPAKRGAFISCGQDGTIRWWSDRKKCDQVLVVKNYKAGKNPSVSQAKFFPDGNSLICSADDGSLRIYPSSSPWINPSIEVRDAHQCGSLITGLSIDPSGRLIATRGNNDTLKRTAVLMRAFS